MSLTLNNKFKNTSHKLKIFQHESILHHYILAKGNHQKFNNFCNSTNKMKVWYNMNLLIHNSSSDLRI